ncbi:MAG TPA: redox-sensitive transcriptional activator SoxR, partial [Acinetobacter ursingii]|nr:redox-sensitive transcriptional activator SoxR [Acinetobacter ursingii]
EVKQAFSVLPQEQIAAKQDWQNMSKLWKEQLDNKILTLLQLRQQLDWCIGCGCLSMDQCPLRNPDDYLAQESSGAHFQQVLLALDRLDQTET